MVLHEIGELGEHFQAVEAEQQIPADHRQVGIGLCKGFFKQGVDFLAVGELPPPQMKVRSPENGEGVVLIRDGEGLLLLESLLKIERVLWYGKELGILVKILIDSGVGQPIDDQVRSNACPEDQDGQGNENSLENPRGRWLHIASSLTRNSLDFHMKKAGTNASFPSLGFL